MRTASHFLFALGLSLPAQEAVTFRQWLGPEELGTYVVRREVTPGGHLHSARSRTRLARMGLEVSQEIEERALKAADGSITFTWMVRLAQEPMRGEATWSPAAPGRLQLKPNAGAPRTLDVPPKAVLWPPEQEARLKEAARKQVPISIVTFSFATLQWNEMELSPLGPAPLPGFPEAVRFRGKEKRDGMALDAEVWISPVHGEIKTAADVLGLPMLIQRTELPPPRSEAARPDVFGQSLKPLPTHPFQPWVEALTVRFEGGGLQTLPEDPQQRRLGDNRYCLLRAQPPSPAESREKPVQGLPRPEDAPFLASTPLADHKDPAFEGLLFRLRAPADAPRWELAQRVTRFVFEWIDPKDFSVGFAAAQEVARHARGDCTEHGVLAVALLRRLGVPARGVVGWVALGETLGLHFWVEAAIGGRWIPVDPTFGEAPASAFRIKLATTDLADLGSVGWDRAASVFGSGRWVPESPEGRPWGLTDLSVDGERLRAPGGVALSFRGGRWSLPGGTPTLDWNGSHAAHAILEPLPSALSGQLSYRSAVTGLRGWWNRKERSLAIHGEGRWVMLHDLDEGQVPAFLDRLRIQVQTR